MSSETEHLESEGSSFLHAVAVLCFFVVFYILIFLPVLLSGHPLAVHETFLQFWPAFFARRVAWTTLLSSGFPLMGDPQTMAWYPVSLVFYFLGGSWNGFVLSAYVLASSFTYGYTYAMTRSRFAALVSAVTYGVSGFFMVRLVHTNIIHTAAWLPLLIWSLEMQRRRPSRRWIAITGIAVVCGGLAGHPQIWVYSLSVAALYALTVAWRHPDWWRFLRSSLIGVVLGVGLAAILLLPMIELAGNSVRSEITPQYAVTYSLSFSQLPLIIFPFLSSDFSDSSLQNFPWIEVTGYVGLVSIALAYVALMRNRKNRVTLFWVAVAVAALLFALGASTPVGRLSFIIPVFNKFRAPGRHLFEFTFSMSVLAGLGIAALRQVTIEERLRIIRQVFTGLVIVTIGLALTVARPGSPLVASLPCVILGITALACWFWIKNQSIARSFILFVVVVVDLGHVGYFVIQRGIRSESWNTRKPDYLGRFESTLTESRQRLSPLRAAEQPLESAPANLSRLWGIASVSGYNPLELRRYAELASITAEGRILEQSLDPLNRSLDILSLRYLLVSNSMLAGSWQYERFGLGWRYDDLQIDLGSGCGQNSKNPTFVSFRLPDVTATKIGIVSSLSCSVPISDKSDVVRVTVTASDGSSRTLFVKAGLHTSEWAWDRPDVRPVVLHTRAAIFDSFPSVDDSGIAFQGHHYSGILAIPSTKVREIQFDWVGSAGTLSVQKVSVGDDVTQHSYAITRESRYLSVSTRWQHRGTFGETSVYENARAMPRAWLVPRVMNLAPGAVLETIHTSKLPDGSPYDPTKVALVEDPVAFDSQIDPEAIADVTSISETQVEIRTHSRERAFMVLSDTYYSGWHATVDGQDAAIYRTNYVLRGVQLPSGDHIVVFRFQPLSFTIGTVLSGVALFVTGALLIKPQRKFGRTNSVRKA